MAQQRNHASAAHPRQTERTTTPYTRQAARRIVAPLLERECEHLDRVQEYTAVFSNNNKITDRERENGAIVLLCANLLLVVLGAYAFGLAGFIGSLFLLRFVRMFGTLVDIKASIARAKLLKLQYKIACAAT